MNNGYFFLFSAPPSRGTFYSKPRTSQLTQDPLQPLAPDVLEPLRHFKELRHIRPLKPWPLKLKTLRPGTFEKLSRPSAYKTFQTLNLAETLVPLLPLTATGSMTLKVDHPRRVWELDETYHAAQQTPFRGTTWQQNKTTFFYAGFVLKLGQF